MSKTEFFTYPCDSVLTGFTGYKSDYLYIFLGVFVVILIRSTYGRRLTYNFQLVLYFDGEGRALCINAN